MNKQSEEEWVVSLYTPVPKMKFINPISREEMTDLSQTGYLIPKEEKDSGFDEWQHEYENKSTRVWNEPPSFSSLDDDEPYPASLDPKGEAGSTKTPLWLVPPAANAELAHVLKLGASKYGVGNWRVTSVCMSTYISAIMRHLDAFRDGEDLDPESGRSHIAHVAANAAILLDAAACGVLVDDRLKRPA